MKTTIYLVLLGFLGFCTSCSEHNPNCQKLAKIHKIENLLKMFSYIISDIDYYIELYKSKSPKLLNLFDMVVRSKACRNAIKFNDELSDDFIINLISSLSECKNPFLQYLS